MKTKQEIFDTVVAHLRKQNARAQECDGGMCSYKSPDGLKCAVGCLIPDEIYDRRFEGFTLGQLLASKRFRTFQAWFAREIGNDYREMLSVLQKVHDNAPPEAWEERFESLASYYGLEYSP